MISACHLKPRVSTCLWTFGRMRRANCTLSELRQRLRNQDNKSSSGADNTLILAGAPGCGKTSAGRIIASRLGRSFYDFDDDVLEKVFGCSVADKLSSVGESGFLRLESEAAQQHNPRPNAVLALSGSVPLCPKAMQHLRNSSNGGPVVLIDVASSDIVARMHRMKLDRIVGQSSDTDLTTVLAQRQESYETCYDLRVIVAEGDDTNAVATKVMEALNKNEMFCSTRGKKSSNAAGDSFTDVVQYGLCSDRGLFLPETLPTPFSLRELDRLTNLTFSQRALRVMERFPLGQLHPSLLRRFIQRAHASFVHNDIVPLSHLESNVFLLECYHGPTASFKDVALQLTPQLMAHACQKFPVRRPVSASSGDIIDKTSAPLDLALLVATSGDTGVAALNGFRRHQVPVSVLYPRHGVSRVQRHQMLQETSSSSSADAMQGCVIGVEGDFDECQTLVKDIFEDETFNERLRDDSGILLSAGNSINWGRLLPQVVFSVSAYLDLVKRGVLKIGEPMDVAIPTGNFGNLLGSYLAKRLGVPIRRLICASNENNVLAEFIATGVYDVRSRVLKRTHSPSVDILLSSNLERFLYLLSDGDVDLVCSMYAQLERDGVFRLPARLLERLQQENVLGAFCSEDECLHTVRQTLESTGVLLDPHTALARHVVQHKIGPSDPNTSVVIASTAHFAKFPNAIFEALGIRAAGASGAEAANACSISEVFSKLALVKTRTSMHPVLERLAQQPEIEGDTIDCSVLSIERRLADYLGRSSSSCAGAADEPSCDTR